MSLYAIYQLKCPECGMQYAQMISDREEYLPLLCPSCQAELEKIRKLSGSELLACGFNVGGG
jgi:predicted nucleic acid-binding Zn ribbon protein